uniref:Putative secreted protein n=1 Tax=Ixodes ricinus TaxID=34613 RepID=A0A0K8RH35_IXORI
MLARRGPVTQLSGAPVRETFLLRTLANSFVLHYVQATSEGELLPSTLQGASIPRFSMTLKMATAMASPSKLVCLNEARDDVPLKCAPSPAELSLSSLGRPSWFPGALTFALCKVMVKRSTAEPIFVEALFLLMGGNVLSNESYGPFLRCRKLRSGWWGELL